MIEIQKLYSRLRCSYICRNLSIGNWPSFVPLGLKRLFQFQFQMKAILIFCRQSGIAAAATHALLQARVVSIFCNSTICPPSPFWSANTCPISAICHRRVAASQLFCCNFTSSTSAALLCICSRMTCKSGHCPCRSECNKFKKSHSKPATDSMKATKPTAHWQYHHLRL